MAGRILPIALATITGISIGVATFDGEFKKQQRQRLEAEYQKELAALASSQNTSTQSTPLKTDLSPQTPPSESNPQNPSSSWSSMLGLWAWKSDADKAVASTSDQKPVDPSPDKAVTKRP